MVLDELKTLLDLYERYQIRKAITHQQQMFDLTMINLYKLGDSGHRAVGEYSLSKIQGLSKMDLFNSLKDGMRQGLILDATTHDGRAWMLTLDGRMYTEALLDEIKK